MTAGRRVTRGWLAVCALPVLLQPLPLRAETPAAASTDGIAAGAFAPAVTAAAALPRLHSLLVSHDGELLVERYFNGTARDDAANVKSVSKTLMSALIGVAIEQGHIGGVDEPISGWFDDLLGSDADPRKQRITVGHLLSMQAGLETTSFYNYGAWVTSDDWVRFALEQPLSADPGTQLVYSTGNTHLLSAILTAATGRSSLSFAHRNLTRPLGFELAAWDRDPKGIYFGGNNMAMTPRQMLAFGEMYLEGGRYGGRQIVPEEWVRLSTTPRVESGREHGRYYGYGWWIRQMAGFRVPYAWGYGGQFIALAPELDLVVATTSDSTPGNGRRDHMRNLQRLMEYGVIAAAADALGEFRPAPRRDLAAVLNVSDQGIRPATGSTDSADR